VAEDEDPPELKETEMMTEPSEEARELQAENAAEEVPEAEPEEIVS
jgi:hypothetical protein